MPDFTAPGSDGERLPDGLDEFQRGLICTVHPRVLSPLVIGEEYRIKVSTWRRISEAESSRSYETLYRRATSLVRARAADLTCDKPPVHLHTWIVSHDWFRMDIPGAALVGAAVTLGAMCSVDGGELPRGEDEPAPEAFTVPHVVQLAAPADRTYLSRDWDELYNDFDIRDSKSQSSSIVTISYGEYVPTCGGIDFEPFVRRAGRRARFHYDSLVQGDADGRFSVVRREWTCIETGKASNPTLASVNIYFSDVTV